MCIHIPIKPKNAAKSRPICTVAARILSAIRARKNKTPTEVTPAEIRAAAEMIARMPRGHSRAYMACVRTLRVMLNSGAQPTADELINAAAVCRRLIIENGNHLSAENVAALA